MKFKLMGVTFWVMIFFIIPLCVGFGIFVCYLAIQQNDYRFFYYTAFSLFGLAVLVPNTKEYFSIVTIDERGVEAKLFGRVWFSAEWSEMQYVAYGYMLYPSKPYVYICFSKEPFRFTKKMFYCGLLSNTRLKGTAMFMLETKKVMHTVHKYVPPHKIEFWGEPKAKDLPKK